MLDTAITLTGLFVFVMVFAIGGSVITNKLLKSLKTPLRGATKHPTN